MLRAKDIMTTDVISVKKEAPIFEAIKLMTKYNISCLPVVEDDMSLVGILSEKDFVVLSYINGNGTNKIVNDYMIQPAIHFEENKNLVDICDFLANNIFTRIPVTSAGKLVGVISIQDILKYILRSKYKMPLTVNKNK